MTYQIVMIIVMVFVVVCTISLQLFKAVKITKYKNDERWKLVQNKANNAAMHYNNLLNLVVCIGLIVTLFTDIQFTISISNLLTYLLPILFMRDAIELAALRYFDKRL